MQPYILIEPINFGELQEKRANAITWTVSPLIRGAELAYVQCSLIWIDENGSKQIATFNFEVNQTTLNAWGSDDTIIDNAVLSYSPLFIRRNS